MTGLFWLLATQATCTSNVPSLNDCPDMIFIDGNENNSVPSLGSGGVYPGSQTRSVFVNASLGSSTYYIYIPSSYQVNTAMPLMILWHGAGGPGTAPAAAQSMRSFWTLTAEANQFIVAAQVATGPTGGGFIPGNAESILVAILNDMASDYNIEQSRIYGWGFSSGGHVMHDKALERDDIFAAYAVNAGVLEAAAGTSAPANANRIMPVFVSVGNQDPLLSYATSNQQLFEQAGWENERNFWLDVFSGGHVLPSDAPFKAWDKICIATILD